jgi:alanine racemase
VKTIYKIAEIVTATGGTLLTKPKKDGGISELLVDSRKINHPEQSLFFALPGQKLDGHDYIEELYQKGVRYFVVTKEITTTLFPEAGFVVVKDAITALQKLAGFHRSKFKLPVIAITGSNGKTIVKEWLYQLLHEDENIVRSPKSFNSQIGVPLSLWQINDTNTLGIFEAGISQPNEMSHLEKIIQPNIGIFTNITEAHSEGFLGDRHKAREKLNLFLNVDVLIYCKDYPEINLGVAQTIALRKERDEANGTTSGLFSWSMSAEADLQITSVIQKDNRSIISALYRLREVEVEIPFTDRASVENVIHCWCVLLYLNKDMDIIRQRIKSLSRIAMRLEMKDAIHQCSLINDSYNSDIASLKIAIDFLNQQNQHPKKTVILSDILQSGRSEFELYEEVARLITQSKVNRLIGIGTSLVRNKKIFEKNETLELECYETTEQFIRQLNTDSFYNEAILLKGARKFRFEIISRFLEKKVHETVLEINLNAIAHNLKVFQAQLKPTTKIMAMVKAFSYGSGSFEIANCLQFNRVDYLAVAYTDEGVELRKNGITLPIMVMNPELHSFETMIQNQLEPDIYSIQLLEKFLETVSLLRSPSDELYPIHLELETGMNRLGFDEIQLDDLLKQLSSTHSLRIASIFSHLVASEDTSQDEFTQQQIALFEKLSSRITATLNYKPLRHILNSYGILRHTNAQFDMVRLGIGLYGIGSEKLMPVSTLKTTISQIKQVKKGDSVGYGRIGKVSKNKTIATVGIGYADGLSRRLSNGKGALWVNGKLAPIIGNICMDMTMLDITDIAAQEGDEVIVFGAQPNIETIAKAADTIPYEILTGISARVKRVYFQE